MKVRATQLGYYKESLRHPGKVFMIKNADAFHETWMEKVEDEEEEVETVSKSSKKKKKVAAPAVEEEVDADFAAENVEEDEDVI